MTATTALLAASLCASAHIPAAANGTAAVVSAADLSSSATELLEKLFGPRKGRVTVWLELETRPPSVAGALEEEESPRRAVFIRKIRATALLDPRLSAAQVQAVRSLLPLVLGFDAARGDELKIERAEMMPVWRAALGSPEGVRLGFALGGAAALLLLCGLALLFVARRGMRAFALETAARRARVAPPLLAGGAPALITLETGPRSFAFLAGKPPDEVAALLATEPASELALLLAHLAEADSKLGAALLAALPEDARRAAASALSRATMADPERLALLEARLRAGLEYDLRGSAKLDRLLEAGTPKAAAELRRLMGGGA